MKKFVCIGGPMDGRIEEIPESELLNPVYRIFAHIGKMKIVNKHCHWPRSNLYYKFEGDKLVYSHERKLDD